MVWMVCKAKSGKYFDGWYGFDSFIHSEEQIFSEENIPYELDSAFMNIVVGVGDRPTVSFVQRLFDKHNGRE